MKGAHGEKYPASIQNPVRRPSGLSLLNVHFVLSQLYGCAGVGGVVVQLEAIIPQHPPENID